LHLKESSHGYGTSTFEMEIQTFTIKNRLGLHARAAALLVKTANRFVSEVTIEKDGLEVNGKSIMGILMLAASKGTKITIKAEGKDSVQTLQTLGKLIENKFGEE
jgi:phosphocarrier protein HPr